MTGRADGAPPVVVLHPDDDVAVALRPLFAGTAIPLDGGTLAVRAAVPAGHKVARRDVEAGRPVRRYGQPIGTATARIAAGDPVHTHNLALRGAGRAEDASAAGADARPVAFHPPEAVRTFLGFRRPDGRAGTRNCILVVPTVNCSAAVCLMVRDRFRDVRRDFPNVDAVHALPHPGGCGSKILSEDHRTLMRVLGGYCRHPNAAASVLVGLGCEKNPPSILVPDQRLEGVPVFSIQERGGTRATVDAVAEAVRAALPRADAARRVPIPVSELVLATNCGGSDSHSGITANPALGRAVDELVRFGGTGVLAETTEILGAEHLLVRRAADRAVAEKLLERIRWWQRWCALFGTDLEANPSPGNIASGITTLFEKSLGGISKGGTTPLRDVVRYAEPIGSRGLVFMDTPAYDPVSVTGLVAGGATVVAFTTGCGSVYGSALVPTVKLSSTSDLFRRMEGDMDVDCGTVLAGEPLEEAGRRVFERVLAAASGERTKSEVLGLGEVEFLPWILGPVV